MGIPTRFAVALLVALVATSGSRALAQPELAPSDLVDRYRALWKKGSYEEALDLLDTEISKLRRIHVQWAVDRAELRFELGRIDEAIRDMELISSQIPEPVYLLRLAEMYRFRGDRNMYRISLDRAGRMAANYRDTSTSPENAAAIARIRELSGDNPRMILSGTLDPALERNPNDETARLAAAGLAFRHSDYAMAAEHCQKALETDAASVKALALLAECYWKSGDGRLEETLDRIEAINPRHPTLKALRAELLLDRRETDKALRILNEGLGTNPRDERLLSLKAAAQFVADDLDAMKATQEDALAFNPYLSDVFRIPGRIASRQYRFAEAVAMQRRALELDPDDAEAKALLGFDLLRLGKEDEGRKLLDEAFEADPYNVVVFNMLQLLDSLERFETIERGAFALTLPKREVPVLADAALDLLDEAYETYRKKYDVELETPIRVQIFDDHDDFMVRSVGLPGSVGFMGICFGNLVTMDSPTARTKWSMNWRAVLWHEFVHVVTLQKTKNRMPRWLSEGISVYEETQRSGAWGQRMEVGYKSLIEAERSPGLVALEGYFTSPKSPTHLMFGYFLAGEFVRFYVEKYGFSALVETLASIGEGIACPEALGAAAKVGAKGVETDFAEYLKTRFAPYANLPEIAQPGPVVPGMFDGGTTRTLQGEPWADRSSPFTDAMRAAKEAIRLKRWDEAERRLEEAYEAFPDYTGGDAPLRLLAQVREEKADRTALIETLERRLATDPLDVSTARRLLELHREDGRWEKAIEAVDYALAVDPFDSEWQRARSEAEIALGRDEAALETLGLLATLDPARAIDHGLKRVEALMRLARWDAAGREALQLLERTPHFALAQERLLEIHERRSAAGSGGAAP